MIGLLIVIVSLLLGQEDAALLKEARANYGPAAGNKALCREMITKLESAATTPALRAYLGGYQAVFARHAPNPLAKLRTFGRGKANIEKAAGQDPSDLDVRFVRLSVQRHAPAILNYKGSITRDTAFLEARVHTIRCESLKGMVRGLLDSG